MVALHCSGPSPLTAVSLQLRGRQKILAASSNNSLTVLTDESSLVFVEPDTLPIPV